MHVRFGGKSPVYIHTVGFDCQVCVCEYFNALQGSASMLMCLCMFNLSATSAEVTETKSHFRIYNSAPSTFWL